ncbi:MAG: hypothetical protein M3033_06875, partial [Acidobacteriota bacterium]|nr:hypothetical protein [Acidobacteriota bacterium]
MTRHPESPAFIRYLQNTIPTLVAPLEEVEWAGWEDGDDTPDGFSTIRNSFHVIGNYFANIDGNISIEEAAFIEDVLVSLGKEEFPSLTNYQLQDIARDGIRNFPHIFQNLQVPPSVVYLQIYDTQNGTDYSMQAK